jgi:hypothetical protein
MWRFSEQDLASSLANRANQMLDGMDSLSLRLDDNSGVNKGPLGFAGVLAAQNNNWVVVTIAFIMQHRRLPTHTSVCP